MGGGKKAEEKSTSSQTGIINQRPFLSPEDEARFQQQFTTLSDLFSQRVNQPLSLETAPAFSTTPDAITQNLISQGIQNIKAGQGAAQRGAAQALSVTGTGDNSALLAALNRQGQISSAGAANALVPIALEQQRQQDIARQGILEAQNRLRLAARQQSLAELAPGFGLLDVLQRRAGTQGTTTQTGETQTTQRQRRK